MQRVLSLDRTTVVLKIEQTAISILPFISSSMVFGFCCCLILRPCDAVSFHSRVPVKRVTKIENHVGGNGMVPV
jgi:hypothetical protein